MLAKAYSATPRGVDALFVTVEVDRIRSQYPSVVVVGLPDTAVREARDGDAEGGIKQGESQAAQKPQLPVRKSELEPDRLHQVIRDSEASGTEIFVAVAGMAAHLPGVTAALTAKPVIGVPVAAGPLAGVDAMLSMVQMPPGVPVATVAVGSAGAKNAVVLAARMLALKDPAIAEALAAYREELAQGGK